MKAFLAALILSLAMPLVSYAHLSGFSLEANDGERLFDVGYSDQFLAGQQIRFDLSLWNLDRTEALTFSGTWVRIFRGSQTLFAGPVGGHDFGNTGFTFIFPEEGDYNLSVRFFNPDDSGSAEHTFVVSVGAGEGKGVSLLQGMLGFIVGVLVGGSALFFIIRKKR